MYTNSSSRTLSKGSKIGIIGAFWCLCGVVFGIATYVNGSAFRFQQQFHTAPPCASGVLHSAACIATINATVVQDSTSEHCGYKSCTPYLNATFHIPPDTAASTSIDILFDGSVSWPPGTPAVLQIWNSTITGVTVNGTHFTTVSYPAGTNGETALYAVALIFIILGALVMTYGLLWKRNARAAP